VGIVREVTADSVHVIHQNMANTAADYDKTISMSVSDEHYTVSGFSGSYPVQGWIRKAGSIIIPLTADLNGNGTDTTGSYNTSTAEFTFDGKTVRFGTTIGISVTGDWDGDGYDDIGGYYPHDSTFYLYLPNLDSSTATSFKDVPFGQAGDVPITGDWNWDGDDDVGVYRAFDANYSNNPAFYFDLNRKN